MSSKLKSKPIPMKKLAQYRHIKFLMTAEKQALVAYRFAMQSMTRDIQNLLKKNKLAKSEDPTDGLEPGWTREVPEIRADLAELASPVVEKYMLALKWVMLGDSAGKKAAEAAKDIGLKNKVTPGIVHATYLQGIDAHSQHYVDVIGKKPPEMPKSLLKASFEQITRRIARLVDQTLSMLKTEIINSIERATSLHNFEILNEAHQEAHDLLPTEGASDAAAAAGESVASAMSSKNLAKEILLATDKFEDKWDIAVKSDLALASATATHQSMLEIYGSDNPDVRIVWLEIEDERVCSFCHTASKNKDGSFKFYKISDFMPSGFNFSRKKSDWLLTIPPAHFRCRCQLVYVPRGFTVDKDGSLVPPGK